MVENAGKTRIRWDTLIGVAAILLSIVALIVSCRSNRISGNSYQLSTKTYLWIEPVLLPTSDPVFQELESIFNRDLGGDRYAIFVADQSTASVFLAMEMTNTGPHEATDVELAVDLVFRFDSIRERELVHTSTLPVGTIAPGQSIVQHFAVGFGMHAGRPLPTPAALVLLRAFENGQMYLDVEAVLSYRTISDERSESGVYRGTIRHAGKSLVREFAGPLVDHR